MKKILLIAYTISGVKIGNIETAPKGIYIQGGKKIVSGK